MTSKKLKKRRSVNTTTKRDDKVVSLPARVDKEKLSGWIADCDPYTPIGPADQRYFDFSRRAARDLRGEDHIQGLFDGITLSGSQSCQLFSGFSGTGKSTELRRLKHLLEEAGYTVLLVDARDYHDLGHALTIEDMMVVLAGSFGEAASDLLGKDVLQGGYWKRFMGFLKTEVGIGDVGLKIGIADLKISLKHANAYWTELRKSLVASQGKLRENCHEFIRGCVSRIGKERSKSGGVVFIVDSLERLAAPMPVFKEVEESIVRILTEYPEVLRLPDCHVVYAIPPSIQLVSPGLGEHYRVSLVMPAVKVLERGIALEPFQPGIDALSELVGRRIPLEHVFGPRRDLLERLVIASGGHVRTLLVFVRELLFGALRHGLPPDDEDVDRVIQPFKERARMSIWRESVPLLERILRESAVEDLSEEEYIILARFMDSYIVLCYRNGEDWYEVHPLIRDHVRKLADRLRASEKRNGEAGGE